MFRNPFLLFLPFLVCYVVLVMFLHNNVLWGDEIRHYAQAENLLHGFFSPPPPDVVLSNGPGYPLFIMLFMALHIPMLVVKLMNAVMLYLSVVLLFKTLLKFVSFKKAVIASFFWGCYYNSFDFITLLYAEVFSVFLLSLFAYLLVSAFNETGGTANRKYLYLSGLVLGILTLTKVIFGYVILFMLLGCLLLWLFKRQEKNYKKGIAVLLIGISVTSPYLMYTYNLTGKVFYWGTSGGNNLYWMSSLHEQEYGSWFPDPIPKSGSIAAERKNETFTGGEINLKNRTVYIPGAEDSLVKHHRKIIEMINTNKGAEKDAAYMEVVKQNIKANPSKFLKNCFSNVGRILFNYPYSYTPQKPGTLLRLPLNGLLVLLILFCLWPTLVNWRKISYPIRYLLFFCVLYLGGSIPGSAEIRMFTVVVPLLLLWISLVLSKTVRVNWKFEK